MHRNKIEMLKQWKYKAKEAGEHLRTCTHTQGNKKENKTESKKKKKNIHHRACGRGTRNGTSLLRKKLYSKEKIYIYTSQTGRVYIKPEQNA